MSAAGATDEHAGGGIDGRAGGESADELIALLRTGMPAVIRWAGALARQLRGHDIALGGKNSGIADTDALTIADLAVQELLVAALRDLGPRVRDCRIEAEEVSGDLGRFAADSPYVIALDPIDGTRHYRDRTGDAYAVMLHVRTVRDILYSLVYFPEDGPTGAWLEASSSGIVLGPDDPSRPARAALDALPRIRRTTGSRRIVVDNFFGGQRDRAHQITAAGLVGVEYAAAGGSLFPLLARGDIAGALYHTPNVYDFPVAMHLARRLGGEAVWAHDGRRVDFAGIWRDGRGGGMLRLPGIVACAVDPAIVERLAALARDWSRDRYANWPPDRPER